MTAAEVVQKQIASMTRARSESGVFVRMDAGRAVVNIGTSTITIPCVGFYPPLAGMAVRVDWVNGSPAVTGPVSPLNPIGTITATGNPRATVDVDGVSFTLPVMDTYTAVVGDQVAINWNVGAIQGKLAAVDVPEDPGESGSGGSTPFSVTVRAEDSGRFDKSYGNWWGGWGADPWASSNNAGIWTYGNRVRDAVGSGTVTSISIYLPLTQEVGSATVGVHQHAWIPPGAPDILFKTSLPAGGRSGWVGLDASYGPFVAAGGRGIGVDDGGYNIWRGTASDGLSGALLISGTR